MRLRRLRPGAQIEPRACGISIPEGPGADRARILWFGRRDLFARAGAAVFGLSAAQSASAKAGQFSKIDIFSLDQRGGTAISSPFQVGGPKSGKDSTYGYAKTDGPILATGYEVRARAPRLGWQHTSLAWLPRRPRRLLHAKHVACRSSPARRP